MKKRLCSILRKLIFATPVVIVRYICSSQRTLSEPKQLQKLIIDYDYD